MLTIIGLGSSASNVISKLDKNKYELVFIATVHGFNDEKFTNKPGTTLIELPHYSFSEFNNDVENGPIVIEQLRNDILNSIHSDEVVICCCVGARISGGLALLITILKKIGKKVHVVIQKPIGFEGRRINKNREYVINEVRHSTSNLEILDASKMIPTFKESTTLTELFYILDEAFLKFVCNRIDEISKKE